ncbi:hypothetical protein R3P38DRAFT_3333827 [Favolaschia claudopus]|uniref:Integrase core domain-containing protein n=1 Tax=Favolaschia claudopus TaxID=2862362 RepID=A0AAV9ZHN8_9AGAR
MATVAQLFEAAVAIFGWPSRMRRLMILHWGILHRAYLDSQRTVSSRILFDSSRHNVRIERLWRDVRKDALETFRQIFDYLEKNDLLDMENPVHSACLFLVFQRRIQGRSRSRTAAITRGYWTGDPGDDMDAASDPLYGFDGDAPLPPSGLPEPLERINQPTGTAEERESGNLLLGDFDCDRDDGN